MSESLLEQVARDVGPEKLLESLTPEQWAKAKYEWRLWARPEQLAPEGDDWHMWLYLAGRGHGKTRLAAEWIRQRVESGKGKRIIMAAPTFGDLISDMLWGESGLFAVSPPWCMPWFDSSKNMIFWPNGAMGVCLTGERPNKFRGKQGDTVWCDELASWQYPEAFDMLRFGMRLGDPKYLLTTTPKPNDLIKGLLKEPGIRISRGSTFDNERNLAKKFLDDIRQKYDGTRIGRQEIWAEVLEDTPGALWTPQNIEETRIKVGAPLPDMLRVLVSVDPSGGTGEANDEQGITVQGRGVDGRGYVLADLSCKLTPDGWGRRAVQAYIDNQADLIVYEMNYGGQMVDHVLKTAARAMGVMVNTKELHASRGKVARAEPVAALYEQGRCSHVGYFKELEDEMCGFVPGKLEKSPNRADALVWGFSELMLEPVTAWEKFSSMED